MTCPLVEPQSTHVSSASLAFGSSDCDATFFSIMESNARLLRDAREVYALDHNPTVKMYTILYYAMLCYAIHQLQRKLCYTPK